MAGLLPTRAARAPSCARPLCRPSAVSLVSLSPGAACSPLRFRSIRAQIRRKAPPSGPSHRLHRSESFVEAARGTPEVAFVISGVGLLRTAVAFATRRRKIVTGRQPRHRHRRRAASTLGRLRLVARAPAITLPRLLRSSGRPRTYTDARTRRRRPILQYDFLPEVQSCFSSLVSDALDASYKRHSFSPVHPGR